MIPQSGKAAKNAIPTNHLTVPLRWASVAGVLVFFFVFLVLAPRDCVGVAPGRPDPRFFAKDCRTITGRHIVLPYNSDPAPDGVWSAHGGPTGTNRYPVVLVAVGIALLIALVVYLLAEAITNGRSMLRMRSVAAVLFLVGALMLVGAFIAVAKTGGYDATGCAGTCYDPLPDYSNNQRILLLWMGGTLVVFAGGLVVRSVAKRHHAAVGVDGYG